MLKLAVQLGNEGREGKPVGTVFITGDPEDISTHTRQMVLNPFRGYAAEERRIFRTDWARGTIPQPDLQPVLPALH